MNGMDIEEWNPKTDKYLTLGYDDTTVFAGKAAAKQALQLQLGLEVDPAAPLFVFIGRWGRETQFSHAHAFRAR